MKVTAIYGSPRTGGNSEVMGDHLVTCLEKSGATVKKFHLNKMNYRGCQGCMGCKAPSSESCVLTDDMTPLLKEIPDTDVLILSSSVYYGDVTSQMKGFIDRIYSFYVPEFWLKENKSRLNPGKKLVFLLAQGNADENLYSDITPKYNRLIGTHGFDKNYCVQACGVQLKGDVAKRADILEKIEKTAEELIG
jgi:multimeric flavodoxin WrbA